MPVRSVAIENPVISSPFDEPAHHFRFDDDGITEEINHCGNEVLKVYPVKRDPD